MNVGICYQEGIEFIETNHRNPFKHHDEERNMHRSLSIEANEYRLVEARKGRGF